ncbi:MAG: hypothetical protein ABIG90_02355 [bacterium]
MNSVQDWGIITVSSLQNLWSGFIGFLPSLIGALVVLIIGWIIAIALGRLTTQILKAFKIDQLVEKTGVKSVEKAGYKINAAHWLGELIKWFLIIVFVMAAADIVGLTQVTDFLRDVLVYLPNIIVAVVILLAAVIVANCLSRIIKGSVKIAGFGKADFLAVVTRWSIMIFALLASLDQLGVARSVVSTLITGFVAMIAIAGGLAFGLGGRDIAGEILKKVKKEITES